jgi:hypothetical protein
MDRAEVIIYGEIRRGGLIERLNDMETVLFGRSLPGSISERQMQLLSFVQTGSGEQPSLLFKLGVAEWSLSQSVQPFMPALGRLQKLEQELEGSIQEGKPVAMRVERVLSVLLTDPVTQTVLEVSSDIAVKARFLESVGPGKSRKGDSVKIALLEDLIIDNYLIAPRGSQVVTEIAGVVRPGVFGQRGEVKLEFKYLEILGPEEFKVKLTDAKKIVDGGQENVAAAAVTSVAGAVILGPIGLATGLLIRGKSLNIEAGTQCYLQPAEITRVNAFPIPTGLMKDPANSSVSLNYDGPNSDIILVPESPE